MNSQKNNSLKYCIKCDDLLTKKNWLKYLEKRSNYICTLCSRANIKRDIDYNKKQRNRHRMRRSAIIFHYGNQCLQCGEDEYTKLTIRRISPNDKSNIDYLYNNIVDKKGYQILCYNCNKKSNHKDKYALRDKEKVIKHYGGYCTECKEDKIERLIINRKLDDINRKLDDIVPNKSGVSFYRWLIKNTYPNELELQVLCFNCHHHKLAIAKYELDDQICFG